MIQYCPFRFTLISLVGSPYTQTKTEQLFFEADETDAELNRPLGQYSIRGKKRKENSFFAHILSKCIKQAMKSSL